MVGEQKSKYESTNAGKWWRRVWMEVLTFFSYFLNEIGSKIFAEHQEGQEVFEFEGKGESMMQSPRRPNIVR